MAAEQMELITIGGKVFALPFTAADSARRKQYFERKQYEKEPTILGEDRGPKPIEEPTKGGFLEEAELPSSNSAWLDSLLYPQTGGAKERISIRIQAAGDLLKKAKAIFDDKTVKNEEFYIPIAELDISGVAIAGIDYAGIGDFIEKNIKEKTLEPRELTTFQRNGDIIISKKFSLVAGNLLDDILRNTIVKLGFLADTNIFDKTKKEYEKSGNTLSIQFNTNAELELLLGRQLKAAESSNSVIDSVKTKDTITDIFTFSGNGIVKIFAEGTELYSKPLGDASIPVTNTTGPATNDEEGEEEEEEEEEGENTSNTPFLKPEEITILQTLGFDYELLRELGSYLPAFFDSLPSCSTDASMLLKHECETSYFVLWSVMFKAQARLQERMKEEKSTSKFLPDIESGMARQTARSLFELHKTPKTTFSEKDILTLFTIVRKGLFTEEQKNAILRAFTIVRGKGVSTEEEEAIRRLLGI